MPTFSYSEGYSDVVISPTYGYKYPNYHGVKTRSGVRNKGDFIHTTPYEVSWSERNGCMMLTFNWRTRYQSNKKWYESSGISTLGSTYSAASYAGGANGPSRRKDAFAKAQFALNQKVLNGFPSWDLLTDFAELGETVTMFDSFRNRLFGIVKTFWTKKPKYALDAFRIRKSTRNLRKVGQIVKHAPDLPSFAGNFWMEYRYGVMPFIYSCQDALNAFDMASTRMLDDEFTVDTLYRKFQVTVPFVYDTVNTSTTNAPGNNGATVDSLGSQRGGGSVRMKAFVSYVGGLASRIAGMRLSDYLNTAWEIVPFSFVVDWFLNISGALAQLRLDDIVASVFVNVTEKTSYYIQDYFSNFRKNTSSPLVTVSLAGFKQYGWHIASGGSFKRSKGSLTAVLPKFTWGLDKWKRQLDTGVLSWQYVKRTFTHGWDHKSGFSPYMR